MELLTGHSIDGSGDGSGAALVEGLTQVFLPWRNSPGPSAHSAHLDHRFRAIVIACFAPS